MASQQIYQAYAQNMGTLVPGQTIVVNKFNVQVERYLSQGGFAHVYLVRTATPVYNTTHHVLKRIAVTNEAMLTEVKKEVDIMRLLKGHPNIVHLIDAAWQRLPNGMYEVFILMEYCPGGGIIDMMNRRLRERLTEAEILQIFVDVCEGVAYMHNLRPPLLHRDLKVENILQSSPTSFKLCDFGSASTVSRPPATTQEIRALEADLNRHTTLQYRAPEMVDLYSRKPVDEKSDVWALGVLLYKLCYYTTPFEEHGQLAILNVQYRIPPYPVYSPQMNELIASMLQEHGIRRPSVFQLLDRVHRLRGTKSRFKYNIPVPQPLSPRGQTHFKPSSSPNRIENVMHTPPNNVITSVSPSSGRRERDEKLEAIVPVLRGVPMTSNESRPTSVSQKYPDPQIVPPMRRGRPTASASAPNSTPAQDGSEISDTLNANDWLEGGFAPKDDGAWKAMAARDVSRKVGSSDAWNVDGMESKKEGGKQREGFGDDFGKKLWDSVAKSTPPHAQPRTSPNPDISPKLAAPPRSHPSSGMDRRPSPKQGKDAFDGLGLGQSFGKPAPTLGEARKLRTGLAVMNVNGSGFRHANDRMGNATSRLTPSPRQPSSSQPQSHPQPISSPPMNTTVTSPSFRLTPQPAARTPITSQLDGLPAESRFPSLEELDASFGPSSSSSIAFAQSSSLYSQKAQDSPSSLRRNGTITRPSIGDANLLKPDSNVRALHGLDGVRSEQVTGVAMRESRGGGYGHGEGGGVADRQGNVKSTSGTRPSNDTDASRPSLTRNHRSSMTVKRTLYPEEEASTTLQPSSAQPSSSPSPRLPVTKSMDWLTGDDDGNASSSSVLRPVSPAETPIIRDSPSKRASLIQRSNMSIPDPVIAQHGHTPLPNRPPSPVTSSAPVISPTLSRFTRAFPPTEETDRIRKVPPGDYKENSTPPMAPQESESASSADEGPEDATGFSQTTPKAAEPSKRRSRKGRQSSVHDLVDLYGGGLAPKDKDREALSARRSDTEVTPHAQKGRAKVSPLSSSILNPPSASSHQLLSPLSITSPKQQNSGKDHLRASPTSAGFTPSPSRSRPQSMFIFPSKSTDALSASTSQTSVSTALIPPEDMRHRTNIRRTSISDIVQRYEGITGNAKAAGVPLSPGLSRPVVGKVVPGPSEGRYSRSQTSGDGDRAGSSLPIPGDMGSSYPSRSPAELTRTSPGQTSTIRTPTPLHHDTLPRESEDVIRRKPSLNRETSKPRFPLRKTTEDSSTSLPENRSSSPERPYQGVGKLIDQWQRKTVEADPPRAPAGMKRGTFAAKRAGVVHDSSR